MKDLIKNVYRRHHPDYKMIVYMGLIMLLGLVIIYAIGPQRANVMNSLQGSNFSSSHFFTKQLISLGLALAAFLIVYYFPIRIIKKYATWLLLAGFLSCLLLAVANWMNWGLAKEVYGATRWFDLGGLGTLQPAEILKIGLLFFVAAFLASRLKKGLINSKTETIYPLMAILAAALFFVVILQKDLGTGLALVAIVLSMLFMAGMKSRVLISIGLIIALVGAMSIFIAPHRLSRVTTFLKGDQVTTEGGVTKDDGSYHITHAKIAIGSGGMLGVGIGNSVQASGYLPEAINDSVFAILGETFGFVGLMLVLFLFAGLLIRLLKIADHLNDKFLSLVVVGVFGWIAAHFILNVAAMIGVAPLTGITLPLLSFGGTSMVFISVALGAAFQASCYTVHGSKLKEAENEDSSGRRRVGRTRNSGNRRNSTS